MALRPAAEFVLAHGGNAVTLRASLRSAVELDLIAEGFAPLVERIAAGSLGTIHAAIRAGATDRAAAEAYLRAVADTPLRPFLEDAQAACLALVAGILPDPAPSAENSADTPAKPAEGTPWRDHFADLFGFGCAWLSWPPEAVWNASPAELTAAFEARVKHLIAMNGGREGDDEDEAPAKPKAKQLTEEQRQANADAGLDPDFDRAGLRALKAKLGQ